MPAFPVALFIFNRPHLTERVFTQIAASRPSRLLVVADGPRSPREAEVCEATRQVVTRVDWPCEVLTNFAPTNLGCKLRMSSGLDWVFRNCREAIILEDDCLPHPSFFRFCGEMLERYRKDERVMTVGGTNFQDECHHNQHSYYFSRYPHVWGWAGWRRSWQHYDLAMRQWPALRRRGWLGEFLGDPFAVEYWRRIFDATFFGEIDSWDYQWVFATWVNRGAVIVPNKNLVSNLGFGRQSTHTKEAISPGIAQRPLEEIRFPLTHPDSVQWDDQADGVTFRKHFYAPRGWRAVRGKIGLVVWRRLLPRLDAALFESRLRRAGRDGKCQARHRERHSHDEPSPR